MRIVQVARRADAEVVDTLRFAEPTPFLEKAVEPLDLGEERRVRKIVIDDPHAVVRINRGEKNVAGVSDGFQVAGGDEPGRTDKREVETHGEWIFA